MIKTVEKMEPREYYKYYCDKCGKLVGEAHKYDDGYINEPPMRKVFMQCRFDNKYYTYRGDGGMMCTECYAKAKEEALKMLAEMGFKEE